MGDSSCWPEQIVDQGVDRSLHLAPSAIRKTQPDSLPGLAFPADDIADLFKLMRHSLIGRDDFVKGVRNLSVKPCMIAGQTHRKVSKPHGLQRLKQLMLIGGTV